MTASPIIFLSGPTAAGKTNLAISLVKEFGVELISVDACQVYRGLDIGTAKPANSILSSYPHALINIREPSEVFSAGEFCRESVQSINKIVAKDKIPMLVGGSMFYFAALTRGLSENLGVDSGMRIQLKEEGESLGWRFLYEKLVKVNPEIAGRIHPNDRQRIQRALEIYSDSEVASGVGGQTTPRISLDAKIIRLGLALSDRSSLHSRIERRIDDMLRSGLLLEVEGLLAEGVDPESPALKSVGYRQVCQHLKGDFDYLTMRERIIFATRQFAKRQLTWMRNTPGTVWFDGEDQDLPANVGRYLRAIMEC
jgi:tRNA dimethylallyltransferase